MRITIKDIARMANTSIATVSNVIGNKSGVGKAKKKQVLDIIKKTGYRPHRSARSLVLRKSATLGFVVSDLRNSVYVDVFRGVESVFRQRGYQVFLTDSEMDGNKERDNIELMLDNRVEALVVIPVHEFKLSDDVVHLIQLHQEGVPFVVMGRLENFEGDYVTSEEVDSASRMARYVMDLGHEHIAFVGHDPDNRAAVERYMGVKQSIDAATGVRLTSVRCAADAPVRLWTAKLDRLLRGPDRPTAMIMVNDVTAITAIQRCKDLGLTVPEDISVVGFGNLRTASVIDPPLTTFAEDIPTMVKRIVEALSRKMQNSHCESMQSLVPKKMIRRRSAAPPPKCVKTV